MAERLEDTRSRLATLKNAAGDIFRKAPDGGICPIDSLKALAKHGNVPPLVVEVGCKNEPRWEILLDEARSWGLHPRAQVP